MEPLFLAACEEGSTSVVSKYLRKVLTVNYCDRGGITGLMKVNLIKFKPLAFLLNLNLIFI